MTLKDIEQMERTVLTPAIVAEYLQCDQQTLRLQARLRPDLLGFPVICIGNRDCLYYCFPKEPGDVVAKTRLATEELYKMKKQRRVKAGV